jgi:DNA-binding phage protein
MKTRPFDPAEYLDCEEAIEAYLADAQADGAEALADAKVVVARARQINENARRSGVAEALSPTYRDTE